MMRIGTLAALAAMALLGACNGTSLNYCYSINCPEANDGSCPASCSSGCTTGNQSFSSLTDECAALQSSSRNNGCALSDRQQFFQSQGCSGTFTETP